jgi:hypothetical protein
MFYCILALLLERIFVTLHKINLVDSLYQKDRIAKYKSGHYSYCLLVYLQERN